MENKQQVLQIVSRAIDDLSKLIPDRSGRSMTDEDLNYKALELGMCQALIAAQVIANVPEYERVKLKI